MTLMKSDWTRHFSPKLRDLRPEASWDPTGVVGPRCYRDEDHNARSPT